MTTYLGQQSEVSNDEKSDIGYYSDPIEAFYSYKEVKESYIKEVATKFKDVISDEVYEALLRYTVNITD